MEKLTGLILASEPFISDLKSILIRFAMHKSQIILSWHSYAKKDELAAIL